jgi:hypothetical protein
MEGLNVSAVAANSRGLWRVESLAVTWALRYRNIMYRHSPYDVTLDLRKLTVCKFFPAGANFKYSWKRVHYVGNK